MCVIGKLMSMDISVPDSSTLSRRSRGLTLPARPRTRRTEPVHLAIGSTRLNIFGEGEWQQNKYRTKAKRKSWRKLHIGLDLESGEFICADLAWDDVGDSSALPGLLDQVNEPVTKFLADGTYVGRPTTDLLNARFGDAVEIIIPPPKNAVPSPRSTYDPTLRDGHITEIYVRGRLAWQASSSYNQRSRMEAQIGRWKGVIGSKLRARSFENQRTEARIGVRVLNKMTELGRPKFEAVT